jgi:acyl carrier protein
MVSMEEDVEKRCIEIIAASKKIPASSITLDSTFEELVIDSLDKINISFEVEDAFAIEIPDDSLGSLKTVRDVVNGVIILREKKAAANPRTSPHHSSSLKGI